MSKIKDVVTKFKAMEKILKNLDGKVTEVGSSIHEVFIMMKMLETQVGQLVGRPMGNKEEYPRPTPRSQDGEGYSNSFGRDEGSH
jgi:energy-converting hydrogenase Eha subunit F